MKNYNIIEVYFKSGHKDVWEADKEEWDDYCYDRTAFIIKKECSYVGIYNMDCISAVIVK